MFKLFNIGPMMRMCESKPNIKILHFKIIWVSWKWTRKHEISPITSSYCMFFDFTSFSSPKKYAESKSIDECVFLVCFENFLFRKISSESKLKMGTTEEILTELLGVEMELQSVQGIFPFDF